MLALFLVLRIVICLLFCAVFYEDFYLDFSLKFSCFYCHLRHNIWFIYIVLVLNYYFLLFLSNS